jgi:aromatic-L-amino-acid/L-tryptophan decarboxylase
MNIEEFKKQADTVVEWIVDYYSSILNYPVKSLLKPGEIKAKLPVTAPIEAEDFEKLMADFNSIIMPGMTHWQHPRFFAYFPANSSFPSLLGEFLTSALAAQCMVWQTSPAAAELEERVMDWLRDESGLPKEFSGVIQDTASTATLVSILTAREKASNWQINLEGLFNTQKMAIYCSTEAHSSIEKAIKIAGIGKNNLRKIAVDENFAMIPKELEKAISQDLSNGIKPLCVVAALGTTGSTAVDPLRAIGEICHKHGIWYHIDAAFAGTAMLLPEMRNYLDGVEYADTYVFNPHKWMMTNFDCTAYYVRDKEALIRTFEIMPEYLKTPEDQRVNNYRDWGIQLGRRFRALKLWFVVRSYGMNGIREKIRYHLVLANKLKEKIENEPEFELLAPLNFNTICFRYKPEGMNNEQQIDLLNEKLENIVNDTGEIFITHTKLNNKYTLRFVIAQTNVTETDVFESWNFLKDMSKLLNINYNESDR